MHRSGEIAGFFLFVLLPKTRVLCKDRHHFICLARKTNAVCSLRKDKHVLRYASPNGMDDEEETPFR